MDIYDNKGEGGSLPLSLGLSMVDMDTWLEEFIHISRMDSLVFKHIGMYFSKAPKIHKRKTFILV